MKTFRPIPFIAALGLTLAALGNANAATYAEDFSAPFPFWEGDWFGTNSTARNVYCFGLPNCSDRGNNLDGLWIADPFNDGSVDVAFLGSFGDRLTSFKLDVAGYTATTLQAFDKNDTLIFSEAIPVASGGPTNPGKYVSYTINSTNGISHFSFSGNSAGNTSIDNLVAVTSVVPEPQSIALMIAGLGAVGFIAKRRRG